MLILHVRPEWQACRTTMAGALIPYRIHLHFFAPEPCEWPCQELETDRRYVHSYMTRLCFVYVVVEVKADLLQKRPREQKQEGNPTVVRALSSAQICCSANDTLPSSCGPA